MENPLCSKCQQPLLTEEEMSWSLCSECAAEQIQPTVRPRCGYHPEAEASGICKRCGTFICDECRLDHSDPATGSINAYCRDCYEKVKEASYYCAWEDKSLFFYKRFWITWREIIFHPFAFFDALPRTPDKTSALTFAYLSFGHAFLFLSLFFFSGYSQPSLPALMGGTLGLIGVTAFWFIAVPVLLYMSAGLVHLGIRLQFQKREFHQTFRIIGYANATQVLGIIPVLNLAAGIWQLVITISGLKRVQKLSTGQAILALILVPSLFVIVGLILVSFLAFAT